MPTFTGTIYDSGDKRISITTVSNTGLAVSRALLDPAATANRQVFLSDFVSSAKEILAELEKQLDKKFTIEYKDSAPVIAKLKSEFEAGDWNKSLDLVALSFVTDNELKLDFESSGAEVWNKKLGLPEVTLEQIVKDAIKAHGL